MRTAEPVNCKEFERSFFLFYVHLVRPTGLKPRARVKEARGKEDSDLFPFPEKLPTTI